MNSPDRPLSDIVLIVDDVPENLSLLHDALDDAGYTVLVATHGEAALHRARQSLPDVILLDALMPGIMASSRITSGRLWRARCSAAWPWVATSTV